MVTTIRYNVDLPLDGIHGEHYMTICSSSGCPPEYPWLETDQQNTCGGAMPCADCQPWASFLPEQSRNTCGEIHLKNTWLNFKDDQGILYRNTLKKSFWKTADCQPWAGSEVLCVFQMHILESLKPLSVKYDSDEDDDEVEDGDDDESVRSLPYWYGE